jgi:hypothetical protein
LYNPKRINSDCGYRWSQLIFESRRYFFPIELLRNNSFPCYHNAAHSRSKRLIVYSNNFRFSQSMNGYCSANQKRAHMGHILFKHDYKNLYGHTSKLPTVNTSHGGGPAWIPTLHSIFIMVKSTCLLCVANQGM